MIHVFCTDMKKRASSCLTEYEGEKEKKNPSGEITPQWRLSLEDLGQPGNGNCFGTTTKKNDFY